MTGKDTFLTAVLKNKHKMSEKKINTQIFFRWLKDEGVFEKWYRNWRRHPASKRKNWIPNNPLHFFFIGKYGFVWEDSVEGFDFWRNVFEQWRDSIELARAYKHSGYPTSRK